MLTDVPLFHIPNWTRVYDLSVLGQSIIKNAQKIGTCLGTYIDVEMGQHSELDRAISIQVMYDIKQPLKSTVSIKVNEGRVIDFDVMYERIPIFSYGCGVIGHGEKDCNDGPYDDDELRFGEWLRASPWKITKTGHDTVGKWMFNFV
ncbi:uncharacterized protein LOC141588782 [Silene latifolia]|uniref:uncharacterized protein LOC141588782 n=1 Tax=Silene latifolia TaxID=37657 RepID=UPI003D775A4F